MSFVTRPAVLVAITVLRFDLYRASATLRCLHSPLWRGHSGKCHAATQEKCCGAQNCPSCQAFPMSICPLVHLNGSILPQSEARISPLDRGFLFAHAAYEVTAVYGGKFVDLPGHIARLSRTLGGIGIPNPHDAAGWEALHTELIVRNKVEEGLVYLEVTGGAYDTRDFAGPDDFTPTVFAYADTKALIGPQARDG